jgi:hypothetical protein
MTVLKRYKKITRNNIYSIILIYWALIFSIIFALIGDITDKVKHLTPIEELIFSNFGTILCVIMIPCIILLIYDMFFVSNIKGRNIGKLLIKDSYISSIELNYILFFASIAVLGAILYDFINIAPNQTRQILLEYYNKDKALIIMFICLGIIMTLILGVFRLIVLNKQFKVFKSTINTISSEKQALFYNELKATDYIDGFKFTAEFFVRLTMFECKAIKYTNIKSLESEIKPGSARQVSVCTIKFTLKDTDKPIVFTVPLNRNGALKEIKEVINELNERIELSQ